MVGLRTREFMGFGLILFGLLIANTDLVAGLIVSVMGLLWLPIDWEDVVQP